MASGRAGLSLYLAAQASTLSRSSDERRMVATASCPVVRRPFSVRADICFLFFSPSSSTDPAAYALWVGSVFFVLAVVAALGIAERYWR
jgi:hypothetical protein